MSAISGPITLLVVIFGTILNAVTVYILSTHTLLRTASLALSCDSLRHKISKGSQSGSFRHKISAGQQLSNGSFRQPRRSCSSAGRPRVYTFFLWLVISDTALLISALLMYCVPNLLASDLGPYIHLFPLLYFVSNTALTASVWLMCALIFDRYRALCTPFRIRTTPTARIHAALAAVYLFATAFSIPRFFEIAVYEDAMGPMLRQTSLVTNQLYMIGYRIVGGLVLYSLLPYIILFVLSLKVNFRMHSACLKGEIGMVHSAGSSCWSEGHEHYEFKQSRKQQHNGLRARPRRNDGELSRLASYLLLSFEGEVPSIKANAHCAGRGGTRHWSGPIHRLARVDCLRGYVKPHRGGGKRGQLLHLLRGVGVLPQNLHVDVSLL